MSSWAQDADEQEKLVSSLTDKVSGVSIDGSGDAGPSDNDEKSSDADSKPAATEGDEPVVTPAEASLMQKIIRSRLVRSTHDVEVQRKDPKSPLYSIKTFEELKLRPELLKGVYASGFDLPSKIQETALPTLLADPPQNMIAQSQSGTGKTAAFILASLSRVEEEQRYPQVLILSPTYELAIQTGEVAKRMAQFCTRITFCYAVRGVTFSQGEKIEDQVILGTPGKIIDWAFKFKFFDLSRIKVFVLDEADIMIAQQGHHDQSIRIHKRLSPNCQMMLFSATYDKDVMEFAEMIISNPVVIRLRKEEETLENIKQYYVVCASKEEKFSAISNIYGVLAIGQTIIFCHTRQAAVWLAGQMTKEGHAVALLSGELTIEQRIAVLQRFRKGLDRVLITTNVCARGIDVEQVTVVVNFDLPVDMKGRADCETYLHRIGRTGRFGKSGIAVNMVEGNRSLAVLKQIEEHFARPIQKLDAEDMEQIEKIQK
ncbi:DEAD-box helicase Dbp80 [Dermacentor andersoni]|uniref:DEAD-box helicase Dbp80 n=1 Tax=Dermacentor andersoni TaxID=34620 RepID=UPI0021556276|nr:DEAD-box helicase Dbp80-like [Dermacentor andersoni]